MKIKVTYEESDLKQLIRLDLARQGIVATDADIVLAKGKAEIAVEVSRDDAALAEPTPTLEHTPPPPPAPAPPPPPAPAPAPAPTKEPGLQVVEGGNNPVDMSDVLGQSARIARSGGGKFPVPERQMMDGESFDFPTDK